MGKNFCFSPSTDTTARPSHARHVHEPDDGAARVRLGSARATDLPTDLPEGVAQTTRISCDTIAKDGTARFPSGPSHPLPGR
jgi:hypothetical protein